MDVPPRTSPLWHSATCRAKMLRDLMDERGLTAAMVADMLDVTEQTVFNWRTVVARPMPINALRVLMFEIERGAHDVEI